MIKLIFLTIPIPLSHYTPHKGLEKSNTFRSASDMFLREPITKLALTPGALLAGLTQWRQGSVLEGVGSRCLLSVDEDAASPYSSFHLRYAVKSSSYAAIANSVRFTFQPVGDAHRLLSSNNNIPWVSVYALYFHIIWAQPAKNVCCHCRPIVLQNNRVCWHLPGVFLSLCIVHHLDRRSDWLKDYPIAYRVTLTPPRWSRLLCWRKWRQLPQTNVKSTIGSVWFAWSGSSATSAHWNFKCT